MKQTDPGDFLRARRPAQKEERRKSLLLTAARLVGERGGVQAFSLNELAREAGMAKSNVYRYFESREALLLELLEQEWNEWLDEWVRQSGKRKMTLVKVIARLTQSVASCALLCSLMAALPAVLEHNSSAATVRSFKLATLHFVGKVAEHCHAQCSELSFQEYCALLHHMFLVQTSLWAYANPCPTVMEVLQEPEMAPFRHDFAADLNHAVLLLARGLMASR